MLKLTSSALALTLSVTCYAQTPVETMAHFYQVADARPLDSNKLASFFAEQFIDHDPMPGATGSGNQAVVKLYGMLQSASSDAQHKISYIEPVGDNKALVRWQWQGTHTGNLFGHPATNKAFNIAGMELWEFDKAGNISALWHVEDVYGLFQQLSQQN